MKSRVTVKASDKFSWATGHIKDYTGDEYTNWSMSPYAGDNEYIRYRHDAADSLHFKMKSFLDPIEKTRAKMVALEKDLISKISFNDATPNRRLKKGRQEPHYKSSKSDRVEYFKPSESHSVSKSHVNSNKSASPAKSHRHIHGSNGTSHRENEGSGIAANVTKSDDSKKRRDEQDRVMFDDRVQEYVSSWRQPPAIQERRLSDFEQRKILRELNNGSGEPHHSPQRHNSTDFKSPYTSPERVLSVPGSTTSGRVSPFPHHQTAGHIAAADDAVDTLQKISALKDMCDHESQNLEKDTRDRYDKFQEAVRRTTSSPMKTARVTSLAAVRNPVIPSQEEAMALAAVYSGGIIGTPPSSLRQSRSSKDLRSTVTTAEGYGYGYGHEFDGGGGKLNFSKDSISTTPVRNTGKTVDNTNNTANLDTSIYDYFTKSRSEYHVQVKDIELLEQEVNDQHRKLIERGLLRNMK